MPLPQNQTYALGIVVFDQVLFPTFQPQIGSTNVAMKGTKTFDIICRSHVDDERPIWATQLDCTRDMNTFFRDSTSAANDGLHCHFPTNKKGEKDVRIQSPLPVSKSNDGGHASTVHSARTTREALIFKWAETSGITADAASTLRHESRGNEIKRVRITIEPHERPCKFVSAKTGSAGAGVNEANFRMHVEKMKMVCWVVLVHSKEKSS